MDLDTRPMPLDPLAEIKRRDNPDAPPIWRPQAWHVVALVLGPGLSVILAVALFALGLEAGWWGGE